MRTSPTRCREAKKEKRPKVKQRSTQGDEAEGMRRSGQEEEAEERLRGSQDEEPEEKQ